MTNSCERPLDQHDLPLLPGNQQRKRFHVMAKPGGSAGNLDCSYCFYLSKETLPNDPGAGRMSDETLERFIQQCIVGDSNNTSHTRFRKRTGSWRNCGSNPSSL